MKYPLALSRLTAARRRPPRPVSDEPLPEIRPGAFAAWASAARGGEATPIGAGDACRTPDGRGGWLMEIHVDGRPTLVCRAH